MSASLAHAIHRATIDPRFRTQLQANPQAAMTDYKLTLSEEESVALLAAIHLVAQPQKTSGIPGHPIPSDASSWPGGPSFTSSALTRPTPSAAEEL
jgi:hypothetical protein